MKRLFLVSVIILIFGIIFLYKNIDTPSGFTTDELAFGYNAALLARTGHDENGRFLPFFVLSLGGSDWRQPVTQYLLTMLFKLFGPSLFLLRSSSALVTLLSGLLIFFFIFKVCNFPAAIFGLLIFLSTPLVFLQSRLALDNIMPIPFVIGWLIGMYFSQKNKKPIYTVVSAVCLGISFYTYKGMRAIVPIWSVLSFFYLVYTISLTRAVIFSFFLFPFFAIIPILNHLYAGAVMGNAIFKASNIYNFLFPFISTFDLGFLFIKGDSVLVHSTGRHGMLLLTTLPFVLYGIYEIIKKSSRFWRFALVSLVSAPFLYGTVDSVYRASRLMALIPIFCLISVYGFYILQKNSNRLFLVTMSILMTINFFDFIHYYFNDYAKMSPQIFGDSSYYRAYKDLSIQSKKLLLVPCVDKKLAIKHDLFFRLMKEIYFPSKFIELDSFDPNMTVNCLILSQLEKIDGMTTIKKIIATDDYYLSRNGQQSPIW